MNHLSRTGAGIAVRPLKSNFNFIRADATRQPKQRGPRWFPLTLRHSRRTKWPAGLQHGAAKTGARQAVVAPFALLPL
jgi:hypothetical protein